MKALSLTLAIACLAVCLGFAPVYAQQSATERAVLPPSAMTAQPEGEMATAPFNLVFEPAEARVGESVKLVLKSDTPGFDYDNIVSVTSDADEAAWEIEDEWTQPWHADDEPATEWYQKLRPFEIESVASPEVTVTWLDEAGQEQSGLVAGATLAITETNVEGAKEGELLPLRTPYDPGFTGWPWVFGSLILFVVLTFAAWWAWKRWQGRKPTVPIKPAEPELPPAQWARQELERRRALPECQAGDGIAIFSHVSEVMRLYIDRRYNVRAIDLTTRECMGALELKILDSTVIKYISDFLDECDFVKFTDVAPASDRCRSIWDEALLIVQTTSNDSESVGLDHLLADEISWETEAKA